MALYGSLQSIATQLSNKSCTIPIWINHHLDNLSPLQFSLHLTEFKYVSAEKSKYHSFIFDFYVDLSISHEDEGCFVRFVWYCTLMTESYWIYRNWYQYWGHCCLINDLGSSPQPKGEARGLRWASQVVNETTMTEIEVSISILSWWD